MSNKTENRKISHGVNSISDRSSKTEHYVFLDKRGRTIIIVACVLIVVGYLLMSGPGSTEQSFNPDIFSTSRIVVAPILCLAGYLLIVVGILWKK